MLLDAQIIWAAENLVAKLKTETIKSNHQPIELDSLDFGHLKFRFWDLSPVNCFLTTGHLQQTNLDVV